MKTEKQLIEKGFKLATIRDNGVKVYCKFTGYEDCIQYYYCLNSQVINIQPEVVTYEQLEMFKGIKNVLDKSNNK